MREVPNYIREIADSEGSWVIGWLPPVLGGMCRLCQSPMLGRAANVHCGVDVDVGVEIPELFSELSALHLRSVPKAVKLTFARKLGIEACAHTRITDKI